MASKLTAVTKVIHHGHVFRGHQRTFSECNDLKMLGGVSSQPIS